MELVESMRCIVEWIPGNSYWTNLVEVASLDPLPHYDCHHLLQGRIDVWLLSNYHHTRARTHTHSLLTHTHTHTHRTPLDSLFIKLLRIPVCSFCSRSERCASFVSTIEKYKWTRLRVESLVWFLTTLALAIAVKQISDVVSLTGGLAATFIFLFPGILWAIV